MDIHKLPPVRTLGILLAENARHLSIRNTLKPGWLDPLTVLLQQICSLPVPADERFQRRETMARGTAIARPVTGNRSTDELELAPLPASAPDQQAQSTFAGESSSGHILPANVRERLGTVLGSGPVGDYARVHDDAVSDTLVRSERAAAVTIGQDIFLRRGQFRPGDPEGMALLAHEMVHVLNAMRPNISWKRATVGGVHEEEREALAAEQQVRAAYPGGWRDSSSLSRAMGENEVFPVDRTARRWPEIQPPLATHEPPAWQNLSASVRSAGSSLPPTPSPTLQPMRAELDRNPLYPPGTQRAPSAFAEEERQRALYRVLLRQVRSDFERGG